MDAGAAVALAEEWVLLPPMETDVVESGEIDISIPDQGATGSPSVIERELNLSANIDFIEYVEVNLDLEHSSFFELQMEIVSPAGNTSTISKAKDRRGHWINNWYRWGSSKHLGEDPNGTWKLRIWDTVTGNEGRLKGWNVTIYGHSDRLAGTGPATGLPAVTGTPQVGQTLTADITSITDADGLDNAEFSYQWVRNDRGADADIPGATGSTYTLTDADLGHLVRVRVSFTDDAGNDETSTSAATNEVAEIPAGNNPATGAPTISGTVLVGETLAADTSGVSDADGLDNATFSYQWLADSVDIQGATDNTYILVAADEGMAIQVRVSFTDDGGNEETLTSAATAAVAALPNIPATGTLSISGTAQVGQTLTADTSGISDGNGLDAAAFSYQWLADSVDIQDATDNTYPPVAADEGKTIRVRVSFTDDGGNEETLTSAATAAVAALPNIPATGTLSISGTAQVGQTLTADTSGISDADGLTNATYSYQWLADSVDIQSATDNTYPLVAADVGKTIQVRVSFTDDGGNEETLTSAATAAVAALPNIPATGLPTISGTAQVGETLMADTSAIADGNGLDAAAFSYQWLADGVDIQGATDNTYPLVAADEGMAIQVRVSFTDDGGNEETLTSAATAAVEAAPNLPATGTPSISGTAQVGETLTADTSAIADGNGLAATALRYQWLADGVDIQGATDNTYILVASDVGKAIKVRVSFTDDGGNE